jgi:hypothetical protein
MQTITKAAGYPTNHQAPPKETKGKREKKNLSKPAHISFPILRSLEWLETKSNTRKQVSNQTPRPEPHPDEIPSSDHLQKLNQAETRPTKSHLAKSTVPGDSRVDRDEAAALSRGPASWRRRRGRSRPLGTESERGDGCDDQRPEESGGERGGGNGSGGEREDRRRQGRRDEWSRLSLFSLSLS